MSEHNYVSHYTKAGSYINIHVKAEDIETAAIKADEKFHSKYRRDAEAGFVFDYIELFEPSGDEDDSEC